MSREQGTQALSLLSLERPTGFAPGKPISDQFLFDEASLGVLTARQSTNYRGHKQVSLGPDDSAAA
ncbi:MAG: hypothetical protein GWP91_24045, partial [Rhodobacterales bacterium]|nr:hypothetical protein [Rhodobacterales bacterium]